MDKKRFKTEAVRAGQVRTAENEHSDPIFATSSYVFHSAEQAALRFSDKLPGNIYSRFTNPTTRAFENRLASLEGGAHCIATASGMSAILTLCMSFLKSGDHVAAAHGLFGSTTNLFNNILSKFGIHTSYLPPNDLNAWESEVTERTKMIFVESPSNPLCEIVDIGELAKISNAREECILVVDNCACTPALQRPLSLGADVVVHSATKFLDGQGRGVGGAIVTDDEKLAKEVFGFLRTAGPTMSPFNAWIFHKGLETLAIRMKESCSNAMQVAQWLNDHPKVNNVYYPGLKDHPDYALAARQQDDFGAIISFEVKGGKDTAWKVIDSITIFSITANLGDAKSTITHPATTTHGRITDEDRKRAGISDGLIRLSIGLEDVEDLIDDLEAGLASA